MPLVILIGASGSGKTTIARAIANQRADIDVRYFDSIGVPPPDQMIAEYGSGENWQRAKTIEWMATLAPINRSGRQILFEGQTRLGFLADGAAAAHPCPYHPVLIDCDDETRRQRLTARGQPELASPDMQNWARFLRKDAQDRAARFWTPRAGGSRTA